jgi:hypothetical protein
MLTCLSIAKKEYQTCSVVAILRDEHGVNDLVARL